MDYKKNLYMGLSSISAEFSGHLFLENIKMEKQRTNYSYNKIIPKFLSVKGFWNGLYPWILIQSFGKGLIVSHTRSYLEPKLKYNKNINNLCIGLSTGILEAGFLSPILSIRNQLNKNKTDKVNKKLIINYKTIGKGFSGLVLKRSLDWSSRYILIDNVKKRSPFNNDIINVFLGSGLSTLISTPVDRILPLIYDKKSLLETYKSQRLSFIYKGLVFRFLSTAQYTTILFLLPDFYKKILNFN
jgi:hypothetical protein